MNKYLDYFLDNNELFNMGLLFALIAASLIMTKFIIALCVFLIFLLLFRISINYNKKNNGGLRYLEYFIKNNEIFFIGVFLNLMVIYSPYSGYLVLFNFMAFMTFLIRFIYKRRNLVKTATFDSK